MAMSVIRVKVAKRNLPGRSRPAERKKKADSSDLFHKFFKHKWNNTISEGLLCPIPANTRTHP